MFVELFLNILSSVVLTLWVGSMFAFGALFAPALFRRLERTDAGNVAGVVLGRIDTLGLVASGVLVAVVAMQGIAGDWAVIDLLRLLLVVKLLALTLVSVLGIRPKMDQLKTGAVPLETLPAEDERRVEFGRLHRLSTALFSVNALVGLVLIALSAARG